MQSGVLARAAASRRRRLLLSALLLPRAVVGRCDGAQAMRWLHAWAPHARHPKRGAACKGSAAKQHGSRRPGDKARSLPPSEEKGSVAVPAEAESEGGGVAAQIPKVLTSIARTLKATASGGGEGVRRTKRRRRARRRATTTLTRGRPAASPRMASPARWARGVQLAPHLPIGCGACATVRRAPRPPPDRHPSPALASLPAAAGGGGASGSTSGSSGSGSSGGGAAASEHEGLMQGDWSSSLKDSAIAWRLSAVKQMHRRRYLMDHSAVELFDDAGEMLLFNFKDKRVRSEVRRWIKKKCALEYRDRDRGNSRAGFQKLLHELQEQWHRRELSSFEYLMKLNELAGHTQRPQPVPGLPVGLGGLHERGARPARPGDVPRPLAADGRADRGSARSSRRCSTVPTNIPKFHYGSHYSTAGFVLYYLMRVEPHVVPQGAAVGPSTTPTASSTRSIGRTTRVRTRRPTSGSSRALLPARPPPQPQPLRPWHAARRPGRRRRRAARWAATRPTSSRSTRRSGRTTSPRTSTSGSTSSLAASSAASPPSRRSTSSST